MSAIRIDIAIPVLNEENRLPRGVRETLDFCEKQGLDAVITVSDNGSTDRTAEVAAELMKENPKVRYLSVGQRGVGRALKKAWSQSDRDVVGYMDVDLATDLKHLPPAIGLFEETPGDLVVTGSRLLPGSKVVGRTTLREITSRGFNAMLGLFLGVGFSDGMCGFKFLRKSTFDMLMERGLENDEWFFNTELLIKAEWAGVPVRDIPVQWTDDNESRVRMVETISKYMKEIFRLRKLKASYGRS